MPSMHRTLQDVGRLVAVLVAVLAIAGTTLAAPVSAAPSASAAKAKTCAKKAKRAKAAKKTKKKACKSKKALKSRKRVKRSRRDVDGDRRPNGRDADVDGDGIPNRIDDDIDGDRIPNSSDRNMDADPRMNATDRDIDGDRLTNTADRDADADRKANDYDHDIDGDGTENAYDADSDSSGDALLGASGAVQGARNFVGLSSDDAFWGTDADPSRARTMASVKATGAPTLRAAFLWSRIEPRPGKYDFELHDGFVEAAAKQNITLLPILIDPPSFYSSNPGGRGYQPPSDNGAFARYASQLVRRYGPSGHFWRSHPQLPELPIRTWQIWNEPNLPQYWGGSPNPAAYAALLKAGSQGIKSADPGAQVVTAGLNDSEQGVKLNEFLDGMYAAGALGSFDVLGLHPYAPAADLVIDQVSRAAQKLQAAGDDARILITELGWATGGPPNRALVVSEDAQANLIRTTFSRLARLRSQLRLEGIYYYNWRDVSAGGGRDHWGLHTGLYRENGSAKPAFQAMREATAVTG